MTTDSMAINQNDTAFKRQTYILRLWQTRSDEMYWRGTVQNVYTGDMAPFRRLSELLVYMENETAVLRGEDDQGLN